MTEFVSVISHVVFWTVPNGFVTRQLSPTFSLFGLKCRFKFFRDCSSGIVKIFLTRLSGSKKVQDCYISCVGSINDDYCKKSTLVALHAKKSCVFSFYSHDAPTAENFRFTLEFIPKRKTSEHFRKEEQKKQDTLERFYCITNLLETFGSLYNSNEHSDYTLKCGQLILPVHKAILAARCDYFAALFRTPMRESLENHIEFENIEPDSLQHVIRYLYTGILPKMPLDTIRKVYAVADLFLYEPLKTKCLSLMMDSFTEEDQVFPIYEAQDKKKEDISEDSENCKELLKQLFLTREWKVFFDVCPALANEMCKPILFGTVKM